MATKHASSTKRVAAAQQGAAAEQSAAAQVAAAAQSAAAEQAAASAKEVDAAAPGSAPDAGAAPQNEPEKPATRAKVSCAEYRLKVAESGGPGGFESKLKVDSWGTVPKDLRRLPKQAKLCGADSRGQVVIASALFGPELEAFYSPMFVKLGFQPLTCKVALGRTQCTSKRKRDLGVLVTDLAMQIFVLAVAHR